MCPKNKQLSATARIVPIDTLIFIVKGFEFLSREFGGSSPGGFCFQGGSLLRLTKRPDGEGLESPDFVRACLYDLGTLAG